MANFDIAQHPDIDLRECVECYSYKLYQDELQDHCMQTAGQFLQKAISSDGSWFPDS